MPRPESAKKFSATRNVKKGLLHATLPYSMATLQQTFLNISTPSGQLQASYNLLLDLYLASLCMSMSMAMEGYLLDIIPLGQPSKCAL